MNNQVLQDGTVVYYAIAINGRVVSQPFSDRGVAEMERQKLPHNKQILAEVVPVTSAGQQILLG